MLQRSDSGAWNPGVHRNSARIQKGFHLPQHKPSLASPAHRFDIDAAQNDLLRFHHLFYDRIQRLCETTALQLDLQTGVPCNLLLRNLL